MRDECLLQLKVVIDNFWAEDSQSIEYLNLEILGQRLENGYLTCSDSFVHKIIVR